MIKDRDLIKKQVKIEYVEKELIRINKCIEGLEISKDYFATDIMLGFINSMEKEKNKLENYLKDNK